MYNVMCTHAVQRAAYPANAQARSEGGRKLLVSCGTQPESLVSSACAICTQLTQRARACVCEYRTLCAYAEQTCAKFLHKFIRSKQPNWWTRLSLTLLQNNLCCNIICCRVFTQILYVTLGRNFASAEICHTSHTQTSVMGFCRNAFSAQFSNLCCAEFVFSKS